MTQPSSSPYDAVIVGSGPGGATVARELARRSRRVLVLEQGDAAALKGTAIDMAKIAAVPGKGLFLHRDASLLVQGVAAGGSSTVYFATAAPPPLSMFSAHGIDLAPHLAALSKELPMGPLPDELVGPMAQRIMQGARHTGVAWRKLDKLIRPAVCRSGCWRCAYGCPYGAKWSARDFLDDAVAHGATLIDRAKARLVLTQDGRATGIEYVRDGAVHQVHGRNVILAAGGIGSPRLLQASGLMTRDASFFSDPVIAVMGAAEDVDGSAEVPMAAGVYLEAEGVALADMTLPKLMYQGFALYAGRLDRLHMHRRMLTLMVKIRDDIGGRVSPRDIDKTLTSADRAKFAHGVELARAILKAAGASRIFHTRHFAAHPGGSIRIGAGVDANLQTPSGNLFVCDASVIPQSWGLPPTLTLLCIGRRLAMHLAEQVDASPK